MAEHVIEKFEKDEFDEVYVMYTKMINSMSFEAKAMKILPLSHNMFNVLRKRTMHRKRRLRWTFHLLL